MFDLNKACEEKDEELRRLTLQKEESDAQRRFFEDELNSARPAPQIISTAMAVRGIVRLVMSVMSIPSLVPERGWRSISRHRL